MSTPQDPTSIGYQSSAAASSNDSSAWAQRMLAIQEVRLSPDQRRTLLERSEAQRHTRMLRTTASAVQQRSNVAYLAVEQAVTQSATLSAAAGGGRCLEASTDADESMRGDESELPRSRGPRSAPRATVGGSMGAMLSSIAATAMNTLTSASASPMVLQRTAVPVVSASRSRGAGASASAAASYLYAPMAYATTSAAAQFHASDGAADTLISPALAVDGSRTLSAQLESLRVEPADDDARTAAFSIFSSYLDTICILRGDVHALFDRSQPVFDGPAGVSVKRDLAKLDSADSLGVGDDASGAWIVFHMAHKARTNHAALSSVNRDIERKLAMLAADGDCPMCLESLAGLPSRTLSCCHRTCAPCWEAWCTLMGGRVFCPLCRNGEFLEELRSVSVSRGH